MPQSVLEHVNVTVSDPDRTAEMLSGLFDWKIRWSGEAISGGRSVHVGGDNSYVAVYSLGKKGRQADDSYGIIGGLNHIGVVVDDLDAVEAKVRDLGFKPTNHGDYEPGRRFYFRDPDGIEIEVVSYS